MEEINKDNYEAYFLDFAEGNLSEEGIRALEVFLDAHPELREELSDFENISLEGKEDLPGENWNKLKKPSLEILMSDSVAREELYFAAVEGTILPTDSEMLEKLLSRNEFTVEYTLWQKTKLEADLTEEVEKDLIYQFGLDRPVSVSNYEAYLAAFTEGLLDENQIIQLESFAARLPSGKKDLAVAKNLRLQPARGIFYPDKKSLYRKESKLKLFWIYRATGVAAALLIGFLFWTTIGNETSVSNQSVAEKNIPAIEKDSSKSKEQTPTPEADSSITQPAERIVKPNLKDWEIREPDPVEYAQDVRQEKKINQVVPIELKPASVVDFEEDYELAANDESEKDQIEPNTIETSEPDNGETLASIDKQGPQYLTLGQLAEQKIKQTLDVDVVERDAMALAFAKKLTDKASQLVDAEVSREGNTSAAGDESLTYTVRVGSFKVSHVKSK